MSREMKHSEVKWLQKIPYSWDTIKGKNFLDLMNRPVRESDEVITCFRDGEVVLRSERRTDGFTMSDKEIGYQGINKGDIVIHGMDGFAGAMGISKSTGKGSPVLVVCNPKGDDVARYIVYYLRCLAMTDVFLALATGIRERSCDLRWKKIAELPFLRPTTAEQKKIADYLDKECGYIDEMVALQELMIEELKSYKQSVITETVTRGLNPKAPMHKSDIDWIGDIPQEWTVSKLKYIIRFIESGVSVNAGNVSANINEVGVLKTSSVSKYIFDVKENKTVNAEELDRVSCPVRRNTIIVSRMNTPELVGACGYVDKDYDNIYLPDRLWQVHFNDYICVKFVWYVLRSSYIRNYYSSLSVGSSSSMQNISQSQFSNALIALPSSIKEQQEICSLLDKKCSEIESLITIKQAKIEELKKYKKSIIYEYVTGKKEVPYGD